MTLQPNGNTVIWIPGASLTFSEDGSLQAILKDYSQSE